MRKIIKIVLIALLILLVIFAVFADLPKGKSLFGHLDLALYLKLISLLGMLIALFVSMGYKRRVDVSQKYQRAKQVLADAESKAELQKHALKQVERKLKKAYAKKEKLLNQQISEAQAGYESRLKALKQQNLEMKEALAKMIRTLKRERDGRG